MQYISNQSFDFMVDCDKTERSSVVFNLYQNKSIFFIRPRL